MPTITSIEPGKKNPKMVNVYLDGQFAFALSQELKILNKLKIGEVLTREKIEQLVRQDQTNRLYEKALRFLSFRPRSKKEVKDSLLQKLRLTDKGEAEKELFKKSVEVVLKKLEEIGQINDMEFAKWWVEQRTKFKKSSPRLIKSELLSKGVDREVADQVLSQSETDPFYLALEAARKKSEIFRGLEPNEFKARMSRLLSSKGFDWDVINKVVDTLLQKR